MIIYHLKNGGYTKLVGTSKGFEMGKFIHVKKENNKIEFSEINMFNMWNDTILPMNGIEYPFQSDLKKSILINPAKYNVDGFFISMFQRRR